MDQPQPKTTHATEGFRAAWRWWLPPALIALALALILVDPFIGDWDGVDYTILALHGRPSSMALGRGLFIFYNHALYTFAHAAFGLSAEHAYLLFKYVVVAQAPLAVIACWTQSRDLSRSTSAATVSALLVTFSPVFLVYSGQVMTDVPALLLLAVALIIHLRGVQQRRLWLVIIGAALLGAGVNLRETVGFFGPWLLLAPIVCGWKFRRRELIYIGLSCAVFFVCALGVFGYWFLADHVYRDAWFGWRESMRTETARHPVSFANIGPFFAYFFVTSPLVLLTLPFAALSEWRQRRLSPMLLLAGVGLFANLLLLLNYSTAIIWRYPLCALPALVPLSGDFLMRWLTARLHSTKRALAFSAAAIVFLSVLFGILIRPVSRQFIQWRALSKNYNTQLAKVPRDAVMLSGAQTIAVTYWRGVGAGEWDVIGTGGGWPGDKLIPMIDDYLKQGRRVFIDTDSRWWVVCGWQRDETSKIVLLEPRFHFRRISETIYEIRPRTDATANDAPDLKRLLPKNRPEDVNKCPPLRG